MIFYIQNHRGPKGVSLKLNERYCVKDGNVFDR